MTEALFIRGTRILSPFDVDKILDAITQPYHKTIFNVLLWTGMRYIEMQRLYNHPEWFMKDRNIIRFTGDAQKKVKRTIPDRYIPIPPQLQGELPYFFKNKKPPIIQGWDANMNRWAYKANMGMEGMSAKTTRKTLEMWMYACGYEVMNICARQGHDSITSLRHYHTVTNAFTSSEMAEIKKRLAGW